MTLPGVDVFEADGQLGVIAATGTGKMFVVVGTATDGPLNTPGTFSRAKDIADIYKSGSLVEASAYWIKKYERPVMVVRAASTIDGAVGAVGHDATGTSVITIDDDPDPDDDFELALLFIKGGTVGTAGITYQLSFDDGRTWGATRALGTANVIDTGAGVTFELAAGTIVAGDVHTARATASAWNQTDLQAALAPLALTSVPWEFVLLVGGVIDSNTFDVADSVTTFGNGRHMWIGNTRLPNVGESEATYATALAPLSAGKASKHNGVCAGGTKTVSAVSGRNYQRPLAWSVAARQASVDEHINIADLDLGPLPGVSIRDANGNPDEHDEAIHPGLDDLRFITAKTWPRRQGVYVTLPRTFAPTGSDFEIIPNRRVMNLAYEALYDYLLGILHKPIAVNRKTGLILPEVATDIQLGGDAVLAAVLLAERKASGARFTVATTDNLLSLPKLNTAAFVLPNAYPRWIGLELGFENPALQIQPV